MRDSAVAHLPTPWAITTPVSVCQHSMNAEYAGATLRGGEVEGFRPSLSERNRASPRFTKILYVV
jgi:hypothetical protein